MARLYYVGPTAEELQRIGLAREDVASPDDVDVWEENWQALSVFLLMIHQWRVGPCGRTGLDYTTLPFVFDILNVEEADRAALLLKLRCMENEALSIFRQQDK